MAKFITVGIGDEETAINLDRVIYAEPCRPADDPESDMIGVRITFDAPEERPGNDRRATQYEEVGEFVPARIRPARIDVWCETPGFIPLCNALGLAGLAHDAAMMLAGDSADPEFAAIDEVA